jgi:hypothetical protein
MRNHSTTITLLMSVAYCLVTLVCNAQTVSTPFYFPLTPGNIWQYKEPPPPEDPYTIEKRAGRDTVFSNGLTYKSFVSKFVGYRDTMGRVPFLRHDDNQVFQYFPISGKEVLIYDFSKMIGDTVAIYANPLGGRDSNIITVINNGIMNIFGKSRRFMTFYNRQFPSTNYYMDVITDSIGITFSQTEPGYQLQLYGCVIDGQRMGLVTKVPTFLGEVPSKFNLYPNYPNPFNPSTTITFSLPSRSFVTLKIFDVMWREVATIVSENLQAGSYQRHWNASGYPSGMYFYRLQAGGYSETKRLILLR